ncbi:hypothetical protein R1flu_014168 [Riccia fluitans]|uniref:Peroxidase n=1 Tax=Riccia fluitans TaxID=41844 RepID=A0ABD1YJ21_9MARC
MDSYDRMHSLTTLAVILLATVTDVLSSSDSSDFYNQTCPQAPTIVQNTVHDIMQKNKGIAAGVLQLQFHDCIITGCDGSILLSSPDNTSEKDALKSSLRGFTEIDQIKSAVEAECPGVVSCADILALAARDGVVEVAGKGWFVTLGRKDGMESNNSDVPLVHPGAFMSYDELVDTFAAKGFTAEEMITLSGAHTLGRAVCGLPPIQIRYYQYNGTIGSVDPSIDPNFARSVKQMCPMDTKSRVPVPLDLTNTTFDNKYYQAVLANQGVLKSDASLITNPDGRKLVTRYSQSDSDFQRDFGAVMEKLINQRWAKDGEIRRSWSAMNTDSISL